LRPGGPTGPGRRSDLRPELPWPGAGWIVRLPDPVPWPRPAICGPAVPAVGDDRLDRAAAPGHVRRHCGPPGATRGALADAAAGRRLVARRVLPEARPGRRAAVPHPRARVAQSR